MPNIMNKFIPFFLLLLAGPWLSGQVTLEREVIGSIGQVFTGANLHLSGTAGEAAVTTESAAGLLLTQGFHQAEPEDLTSVYITAEVLSGLAAYPNPAQQQFWVQITSPTTQRLTFEVLDVTGRKLSNVTHTLPAGTSTALNFNSSTWPAGIYLVRLLTDRGSLAGSLRIMISGN